MKRRTTDDFVVETVGHCFICMENVSSIVPSEKLEGGSTPSHSLLNLSRYLKIKIRRVFKEAAPIPEYLLEQVDKSILKVTLCEKCASLNRKLSRLFRQLEKIEIEAASYLQLIQGKLARADQDPKSGLISKLKGHGSTSDLLGKLEVAEVLRNETMQRCSQKLSRVQPNVKIQKMSEKNIQLVKPLKAKCSLRASSPVSSKTCDGVTPETFNLDSVSDHSVDGYLDDIGEQNEHEGSIKAYSSLSLPMRTDYRASSYAMISSTERQKFTRNPNSGKWKCNLCLKEFSHRETVNMHYQNVHLKVRFMCKLCHKVFTTKSHLTVHQKSVHLKQRFDCQFCSKSFSSSVSRRRHIRNKSCAMMKNNSNTTSYKQQDNSTPEEDNEKFDTGDENQIKEEHT